MYRELCLDQWNDIYMYCKGAINDLKYFNGNVRIQGILIDLESTGLIS